MINLIGAWFAVSIVMGIGFGMFCAVGRGEYVKPVRVWWWELLINITKWVVAWRISLQNKVYMHKVKVHGHKDVVFASRENTAMQDIVDSLTKERAQVNARSESLDAQVQEGRIKHNKRVQSLEDSMREFFDNKA